MRFLFEPWYKTPCDEMIKLRQGLDERGIKWRDESVTKIVQIYRTKFDAAGYFFSVIWGHGTYGQYEGLLECMSFAVDESGEPKGSMTAEEILRIVDWVRFTGMRAQKRRDKDNADGMDSGEAAGAE